jgi:hypothetical protein
MGKECALCGNELKLFDPKYNIEKGAICKQCFGDLGFSKFKDALMLVNMPIEEIKALREKEIDGIKAVEIKPQLSLKMINVAGMNYDDEETGENRQEIIQKALDGIRDSGGFDGEYLWGGYTNKEIKDDYNLSVSEYEAFTINGYIEKTEYEGNPAAKVYMGSRELGVCIGWVPKSGLDFIYNHEYDFKYLKITGGHTKLCAVNDSLKEAVVIKKLPYVVTIYLEYKE